VGHICSLVEAGASGGAGPQPGRIVGT
jgi:hypothetical protein